jgi:IS30 family transposase
MGYKQLDYLKRCKILGLWKAGHTQAQIAKEVGVHQSTISREFNRNMTYVRTKFGSWQYKPDYAQGNTDRRHKGKNKKIKMTKTVANIIREKLHQQWSPDQISGYAKKHQLFSIGKEWIYQFILKDKEKKWQNIFKFTSPK